MDKKHELIPDFLIIGAGKSGTTSLDHYLKQHPQIFIPRIKEPNFFGYENTKEEDFKGKLGLEHFKNSITNLEQYLELFANAEPGQLKGETSNTYMYHLEAPNRIKHYNPSMKLIAILRQPAGRLYSRFLHLARESRLPTPNFSDCLDTTSIWWTRNDLIKEGFYFKNLERYYSIFPKEQIKIYLYEDFNKDPQAVISDIFEFLKIDQSPTLDVTIKYNQSGFIKNKFLNRIYGQKSILSTVIKTIIPEQALKKIKSMQFIKRSLNDLRAKNLSRPKMDPGIRSKLTNEVYKEDILKLQELIGKDLSHWLVA
jgi:hypothetical protein